jgi:hypothetical protein
MRSGGPSCRLNEERRIALEEKILANEKKMEEQRLALEFDEAERSIMFMNPNSMNKTARAYWEFCYYI